MDRDVALAKLKVLAEGAALARKKLGNRAEKHISAVGWGSARLARNRGQSPISKKSKRKSKGR
jgi:hypothetical protein